MDRSPQSQQGSQPVVCYFIVVAVPEQDFDAARRIVPRGFSTLPIANSSANSGLPAGYSTFLLVSCGCSCSLYQRDMSHGSKPTVQQLRQKYAKKGWSENKIDRALEQSMSSHSQKNNFLGFRDDVMDILGNISGEVSKFALLIHWFNGDVDDERVELDKPQTIKLARLSELVPELDQWLWVERPSD